MKTGISKIKQNTNTISNLILVFEKTKNNLNINRIHKPVWDISKYVYMNINLYKYTGNMWFMMHRVSKSCWNKVSVICKITKKCYHIHLMAINAFRLSNNARLSSKHVMYMCPSARVGTESLW